MESRSALLSLKAALLCVRAEAGDWSSFLDAQTADDHHLAKWEFILHTTNCFQGLLTDFGTKNEKPLRPSNLLRE